MGHSTSYLFLFIAAGLLAGIILMLESGRLLRRWHMATKPPTTGPGAAILEGSVFGLMSLLVAFTFNGAASRFDQQRHQVVEETNAIDTAYRRIDVLPAAIQPALRDKFKRYVDVRLSFFRHVSSLDQGKPDLARAARLQDEIWALAVTGAQNSASPAVMTLVLSSLNEMFDIMTTRTVSLDTHPPPIIFGMLVILVLTCSLIAGHAMAGSGVRHWLQMMAFAVMMTVVIYVIVDIEYPRMGLITVNAGDWIMNDLRQTMN